MEKITELSCEQTLEYVLWKLHELNTKEEIHEYIKSMLTYIHSKNMEEIESMLPIALSEVEVKA